MKWIYFCVIVCLLSTFNHSAAQITLNGKILNYDGKSKIYFTATEEGLISPYGRANEVIIKRNGDFRISVRANAETPISTLRLRYKGLTYSFLYRDPSEIGLVIDDSKIPDLPKNDGTTVDYDAALNQIKTTATVSITGDFARFNSHYNKKERSFTRVFKVGGCDQAKRLSAINDTTAALHFVDSLIATELNELFTLTNDFNTEDKKSDDLELAKFIENQIYEYYGNIFLSAMMLKRIEQAKVLSSANHDEMNIYDVSWEKVTENFLKDLSMRIVPAPSSFEHFELLLNLEYTVGNYREYDLNKPHPSNDEFIIDHLLNNPFINDPRYHVDRESAYLLKLHYLSTFLHNQSFFSPTLLRAVHHVRAQYPGSALMQKFAPQIKQLEDYLHSSNTAFKDAVIINTNYFAMEDLLEQFKGRNILLDVWATWCPPCIEDFDYKSKLTGFLARNNIVSLYISIDKESSAKKWESLVNYNQLTGYHILASDILIKSLWEYLSTIPGRIPRYALIDTNGKLFLGEAARVSESDKLLRQLNELVNIQR